MIEHDPMSPENQEGSEKPLVQSEESKETEITREDSLKRSAQMKAAVIALLNNAQEPVTRTFLNTELQGLLTELDYKPNHFDNLLYTLSKNGLIKKLGKNTTGAGYLYAGLKYDGPMETSKVTGKPVRKYTKRASKVENLPTTRSEVDNVKTERINRLPEPGVNAAVTVDIVKSSGRIRVAIGGISIEIGVVE